MFVDIHFLMKFNLVIPNLLLASGYPGDKDPNTHKTKARQFIDAGVQVVVNIMTIKELKRMSPYQEIMLEYAKEGIIFYNLYSNVYLII
jgi:hypothetical protein